MADGVSEEKQRAYFERTKKGMLRWLADQGGSAPMREMHDYSASQFLVAHQGFSKLMEACVDEGLVEFDKGTVSLTDEAGRSRPRSLSSGRMLGRASEPLVTLLFCSATPGP